jgi:hypothetical protein
MDVVWLCVAAGIVGGAAALAGLYLLAARKAARSGERALTVFLRVLFAFSLLHGLSLVLVAGVMWLVAPLFLGPIPAADRDAMEHMFIPAGLACVLVGGVGLRFTWRSAAAKRPPS